MGIANSVQLTYQEAMKTRSTQGGIPLGTRGVTPDGRVFRYAKNGATALVAGLVVSPPAYGLQAVLQTSDGSGSLVAGTTVRTSENVIELCGSFSTAGFLANAYQGGWLLVGATWDVAAPMALKIKSHTAGTAGGTSFSDDAPTYVTLEDGVFPTADINTSMGFCFVPCPYNGVLVAPANAVPLLPHLGVPITAVPVSYYFWLQTWGPCMVRMAEVCTSGLTLGRNVIWSFTAATTGCYVCGSSNLTNAQNEQPLGTVLSPGAAGGYTVVDLRLMP